MIFPVPRWYTRYNFHVRKEENFLYSQKLYGSLFESVSEKLTGLFRKAKTILSLFLATLDGVIVFDTDAESETGLLIKGERSYYVLTIL